MGLGTLTRRRLILEETTCAAEMHSDGCFLGWTGCTDFFLHSELRGI